MSHRDFCVGDHVVLAPDYHQYHDAINGPLKPGDVGFVVFSDIHNGLVRARVEAAGYSWFYDSRALRRAPASLGLGSITTGMQGLAVASADESPANQDPSRAAVAATPAPLGAPAVAPPVASGFTFSAGPAAASPLPVSVDAPAEAPPVASGFTFSAGPAAALPLPVAVDAPAAEQKLTVVSFHRSLFLIDFVIFFESPVVFCPSASWILMRFKFFEI